MLGFAVLGHCERMGETTARWSLGKRLGFVFLAVYLCLAIVPDMLGIIPGVGDLWLGLWAALMPVLGNAAFGIEDPIVVQVTGSGDMTWDWIRTFWLLVLALVAAIAVVVIDRKGRDYAVWYARLRVLVRYSLALALFSYGFAKLTGNQFMPPGPLELTRTYGESSPMGLAWTFMGYSTAYMWFTGLAEVLGGALLLIRRTTTLGALVAAGVMANVVAINFCFDVPVKLYSSLLLGMAVFLAAHDARRLVDVLILGRTPAPAEPPPTRTRRLRIARVVAKSAFMVVLAGMVAMQVASVGEMAAMTTKGPLAGAWDVEALSVDGVERPASDADRWRQIVIGEFPYVMVRPIRGEAFFLGYTHEADAGTLTLIDRRSGEPQNNALAVEQTAPDQLVLRGPFAGTTIAVTLRRVDTEHMQLVTRGFHWVNEYPHNR